MTRPVDCVDVSSLFDFVDDHQRAGVAFPQHGLHEFAGSGAAPSALSSNQ